MKLNPSSLNMEMKFHAAFKRKEVTAHFAKWYDGVNKQLYHLHRAVINYIWIRKYLPESRIFRTLSPNVIK